MDLVSSLSSKVDTELDELFLGEHTLLENKLDSMLIVSVTFDIRKAGGLNLIIISISVRFFA